MMREMMRRTNQKSLSIDKRVEGVRNLRSQDILRNKQFKFMKQQDRNEVLEMQKNQKL